MTNNTKVVATATTKTIFKCSKNQLKTEGVQVYVVENETEGIEPKENKTFFLVEETEKEIKRLRRLTAYLTHRIQGLVTEIRMASPFNISINFSHPNSPLTANLRVIAGKLHINGMAIYKREFAKAFLENYVVSNSKQEEELL